ncbi:MAG TPA: acetyl-CoA carboxylase, carboxyltransferase subunit beta [Ginsengibacter sp.]|nr:acetyl-CoA carboxylase, carboxyltransferase subunit beta [Chitinophagaceae bacterium]HRN72461.1 acetyl-CoA carboxylase, carboxyltransferase subunit beta [Ginsengibacter sp.]HRP18735.1 acetyl-CoA carboxylase, carboxyltransferase subunit beta [Ginsengibacter sp.]HRP44283.1 acetyl-CoA carboxylase, carboxyltransferase subunit beta [Ginsengibacter sp.]
MKQDEDFDHSLTGETTNDAEKRSWFRRMTKNITTSTKDKKETPDGLWTKCPQCKYTCTINELEESLFVCPKCGYHHRIGSKEYFEILFDKDSYKELFANILSKDFLGFVDLKPYSKRLEEAYTKTQIHDSITVAHGKLSGKDLVIACMDFDFIGGSLGSVMGEKIVRGADYCLEHRIPFMIINKSGGARMMESAFSLMQLAKTSGRLVHLSEAKIPYFSLCTDPTFGGTTASFAMLGDIIMAEPGALIGFAGPRVIKETIKKDLPPGFQRSEFLLEHGFLDFIVSRKDLKSRLAQLLTLFGF